MFQEYNDSIGHEPIYKWIATANKQQVYKEDDIPLSLLPFEEIFHFTLIPIKEYKDIYAPIRICTNYKPFRYFRRIIFNSSGQLETVLYVVITEVGGTYVFQYPQCKYYYFKDEVGIDGISW